MGAGGSVGGAFPGVGFEGLQDLVGDPDRAEAVGAVDPGAGAGADGVDEVFQFQREGLAALGLDVVDPEDLAEDPLFDG